MASDTDQVYRDATGVDPLPAGDWVLPVVSGINKGMWLYRVERGATGWEKSEAEARGQIDAAYAFRKRFWDEKVRWMEAGDRTPDGAIALRVNGEHYVASRAPVGRPSVNKGHAGRVFRWRMFGDDMIRTSDDVWYQGHIPESHREALQDNAEWVSDGE